MKNPAYMNILDTTGHVGMPITLTPGQAVSIHGWATPRLSLRWRDVADRHDLTYGLCRKLGLTPRDLHRLQPSIAEWVQHGAAGVEHALEMHELWDLHPIRDLRADLADILSLRWGSETLARMRVTYEDLIQAGMTPATMRLFGLTVAGWISLGFSRQHLATMTDADVHAVFLLTRQEVESCLP